MKSVTVAAELMLMLSLGLVVLPDVAASEPKKLPRSNVVTEIVMDTDRVNLPCSYNGSSNCFWTHGTETFRKGESNGYFNWLSSSSCDMSLLVQSYRSKGIWTCVFPDLHHAISYRVKVLRKPSNPVISYNGNPLYLDNTLVKPSTDGEVRLSCKVEYGIPGPEAMIWTVDGVDLDLTHQMEVTLNDDRDYFNAKSTLILKFDGANLSFRLPQTKTVGCRIRHREYKDSPKNEKSTKTYNMFDERIYPTNSVNLTHTNYAPFLSDPIENTEMQPFVPLMCEANGAPKPHVITFSRLRDDNQTEDIAISYYSNGFTVKKTGTYWCKATNKLPNGIETTVLSNPITVHPVIDPEHAKTAIENSGIILDCDLKNETDECAWLHEGITFFSDRPNEQYPNHRVEKSGTSCNLIVKKVTQEDGGYWQCIRKQGLRRNLVYFLRVKRDTI